MNDWLREFPVCHPAYTVYCTVHTSFHWLEHSIALKTRDKISEGTISCKPKEAQSFIFFCNSAHSIGDLILNYGSEYQKVMTAWKCMSPAQTCPLNSRLIYPTARLTSPLGSLIIITDFQVPNGTPDLIPALLPYLKKWQFHSSSCSDLSLSYPPSLFEQEILLVIIFKIYPQSDHFSPLTLQLPWSKPPSSITSIIAVVSTWPPWLCLWYPQSTLILAARVCQVRPSTKACSVSPKKSSKPHNGQNTLPVYLFHTMLQSPLFYSLRSSYS